MLVLFRHHHLLPVLEKAGWIGVDLFFVLSGFLVSGLLFQEYREFHTIAAGRFLARRGFKIYPLFYLYLMIAVAIEQLFYYGVDKRALLADIFFIQSYHLGVWPHTWSLAVEEHFYIGLTLLVLLLVKTKLLDQVKLVTLLFFGLALLSFSLRLSIVTTNGPIKFMHHFATHLRMDSLLFGVLISYYYHFRKELFVSFFQKNRKVFYFLSTLLLLPAFLLPAEHPFMYTIGLTFIYTGFGILLSLFITDVQINRRLDRLVGRRATNLVSVIGYCSYAIYLFHFPLLQYIQRLALSPFPGFLLYFLGSMAVGIIISKTVERRILKLKDRWIPRKAFVPVVSEPEEKSVA